MRPRPRLRLSLSPPLPMALQLRRLIPHRYAGRAASLALPPPPGAPTAMVSAPILFYPFDFLAVRTGIDVMLNI